MIREQYSNTPNTFHCRKQTGRWRRGYTPAGRDPIPLSHDVILRHQNITYVSLLPNIIE